MCSILALPNPQHCVISFLLKIQSCKVLCHRGKLNLNLLELLLYYTLYPEVP